MAKPFLAVGTTLHGTGRLQRKLNQIEQRVRVPLAEGLTEGAELVNKTAIDSFSLTPPSSPGNPPAVDTGALRDSAFVIRARSRRLTAYAGFRAAYAAFLELGTARIRPRPFLRRALIAVGPEIVKNIRNKIRIRLKGLRRV